ncbi:MAG: hypothetical protein HOP09_11200 [Hyphomicrobium sp.]|nr:hypothetical protein [Hyphomicrobium sp.]
MKNGQSKVATNIGPYLIDMPNIIVEKAAKSACGLPIMDYGNKPSDGGNLILSDGDASAILAAHPTSARFLRRYVGPAEFVRCTFRHCIWVDDADFDAASAIPPLSERFEKVRQVRIVSKGKQSNDNAKTPHRFVYCPHRLGIALIVPRVTSENRPYLPVGLVDDRTVVADTAAAAYDAPLWLLAIVASRLHQQWIATVCVRLRTDFRYSNTLGWNTFPVPPMTENQKAELTRCAEDILLGREAHFPATIADLYAPESMPADLRAAHDRNDETLERIYIGRRFKNDTERLEKLFDMYTKMIKDEEAKAPSKASRKPKAAPEEGSAA